LTIVVLVLAVVRRRNRSCGRDRLLLAVNVRAHRPHDESQNNAADAPRFARILARAVALTAPKRLEQARARRNIAQALRAEIEEAKEVYEEQFGRAQQGADDHFREALVRVLARGDEAALGEG
jgi:hypothetical protein